MIIEVVGKEIEKLKGEFESVINGMNMVGKIPYNIYSELYDEGTKQIQKAYELGKAELEKENAELKNQNNILSKALDLYVNWADECGIAWDNFPDMAEKWEKLLKKKVLVGLMV